jgi:hypothetical protein
VECVAESYANNHIGQHEFKNNLFIRVTKVRSGILAASLGAIYLAQSSTIEAI